MTREYFGERLMEAVRERRSHVVVGIDPDYDLLPPQVRQAHPLERYADDVKMRIECFREFLDGVVEAVAEHAVAVKIQLAYFEALGAEGYGLYEQLVKPLKQRGLLVIADGKRGDIGSTAEAYARAHLEVADADALTVNPYLGTDSMEPFLRRARDDGKGLFVLVKTSNASSVDIQDLELASGKPVYARVAELVGAWGEQTRASGGYSSVGAVVGGTHPREGSDLRILMPGIPFLVPGYGAQGAAADDLKGYFDDKGLGAVVNSSRAILYAYRKYPELTWQEAARREARDMQSALWRVAGLA